MTPRAHSPRRRGAQEREGAVMLVVMLILLVATTTATISVQSTQYELRAAGYQRESQQARYISEIALMSTLAWIDSLGDDFITTWDYWETAGLPAMHVYGEPEINPTFLPTLNHHASRVFQTQIVDHQTAPEVPPTNLPTGGDLVGSLGPRSGLMAREPVVDITDCQQSTAGHTPGAPIGGGGGSSVKIVTFYCTMTARARLCSRQAVNDSFIDTCAANPVDSALGATERLWDIDVAGNDDYEQDRYQVAHDSRATFITPEMIVPVE